MKNTKSALSPETRLYSEPALANLKHALEKNHATISEISNRIFRDVSAGRSLFVFGSGHSALLPLELYHRAGGPSFLIPLVADFLMPQAGPPVVRVMERTPGSANFLLDRAQPKKGEMVWIVSQSGINGAVVDFAHAAKKRGLFTVAFTSVNHSQAVSSRHPSRKKLYEICDRVMDLCGVVGDAAAKLNSQANAGPLSTLTSIFLAHTILTSASARLEKKGIRCVYTSVNTPAGEKRNRALEKKAAARDPLLR